MKLKEIPRAHKASAACRRLAKFLGAFEVITLDAEIARQGGFYRREVEVPYSKPE